LGLSACGVTCGDCDSIDPVLGISIHWEKIHKNKGEKVKLESCIPRLTIKINGYTMKSVDKSLFRHIMINLALSSLIVLLMWYIGGSIKGLLFDIKLILDAPSFIIVAIFKGVNAAMHFTSDNTYRAISFIFYSIFIALIQIIIYKRRIKKNSNNKV
jgi:hypothetical protein